MKLPKLNKACSTNDLWITMNHVFVTKDYVVATNSSVLVEHKTSEFFQLEFINNIPEKGMYITRKDWAQFTKEYNAISMDKDLLVTVNRIIKHSYSEDIFRAKTPDAVGKFPDYKSLVEEISEKPTTCGDFGIDAKLLLILQDAIGCNRIRLQATSDSDGIIVTSMGDCKYHPRALIMPYRVSVD